MGDQELAAEGGQGGARVDGSAMAAKSGSGRRRRNGGADGGPVLPPPAETGKEGPPPRVVQGMNPVSSENSMHIVKVLALRSSGRELHTVLNFIRGFPCLERLYVIFHKHFEMDKKDDPQYDPPHPIECLQSHLKKWCLSHS